MGCFSYRGEVFIWKILSWLCWDPALKKRDPRLAGTGWKTSGLHINAITNLWRNNCIFLICLYESLDGMKNKAGQFSPPLYIYLFNEDVISVMGRFLFHLPKSGIEYEIPEHFLLMKILNKTTLPNSVLTFNSNFLLLFINVAALYKIKNTNVFQHVLLSEKQQRRTFVATWFSWIVGNVLNTLLSC